MKDNFKLLNNIEMDLDKYEDLNIDKDKLKKKMRTQIKTKNKFKKNISIISYKYAINIRKIANKYINFIFYNIFQSIILFVLHLYFKHYIFHFHKS